MDNYFLHLYLCGLPAMPCARRNASLRLWCALRMHMTGASDAWKNSISDGQQSEDLGYMFEHSQGGIQLVTRLCHTDSESSKVE